MKYPVQRRMAYDPAGLPEAAGASRHALGNMVPEEGIEPTRGVNPTGF
jgi:hypothetical protein